MFQLVLIITGQSDRLIVIIDLPNDSVAGCSRSQYPSFLLLLPHTSTSCFTLVSLFSDAVGKQVSKSTRVLQTLWHALKAGGAYIVEDVSENYIEKPFRESHCLSVRSLLNLSFLVQIAIFLLDLSILCLCLAQSSSQIAPALSWVWLARRKTVLDFRLPGLYKFKSEDVRKSTLDNTSHIIKVQHCNF